MGSLIFPWKDVVYVCLILFLVLNNFVLLLMSFHITSADSYSRVTLFIYSFISVSVCSVACICLFACLPAYVSISFHYIHLVIICVRHTDAQKFVSFCLLVCRIGIQNVIYVDRNEDDKSNRRSSSSDWLNKYVCTIISMFFRRCHSTIHRRHKLLTVHCIVCMLVCVWVWEQ